MQIEEAMRYVEELTSTYTIDKNDLKDILEGYKKNNYEYVYPIIGNALKVANSDTTDAIIQHFSKEGVLEEISSYICELLTTNYPRHLLIEGLAKDKENILISSLLSDIKKGKKLTIEEQHRIYGILSASDVFSAICMCGGLETLPEGLIGCQDKIRLVVGNTFNLLEHINNVGQNNKWLHNIPEKKMAAVFAKIVPELLKDKEGKFQILLDIMGYSKIDRNGIVYFSIPEAIADLEKERGAGYVMHELVNAFLHPDATKELINSGYLELTSLYQSIISTIMEDEEEYKKDADNPHKAIQEIIIKSLNYLLLGDKKFLINYIEGLSTNEAKRREGGVVDSQGFMPKMLNHVDPRIGALYKTAQDFGLPTVGANIVSRMLSDFRERFYSEEKLGENHAREVLGKESDRDGMHLYLLLKNTNLHAYNLSNLDFSKLNITGVNFSRANLTFAKFDGSILIDTNFNNARLDCASFRGAVINGLTLRFILEHIRNGDTLDLRGVIFIGNLKGFDLSGLDLSGADFSNANTDGLILTNANLDNAKFEALEGLVGIRGWQLKNALVVNGVSDQYLDSSALIRDISYFIHTNLLMEKGDIAKSLNASFMNMPNELQKAVNDLFNERYEQVEIGPIKLRQEYTPDSQKFFTDSCMMSIQSGKDLNFCMKYLAMRSCMLNIMKEQNVSLSDAEVTKVFAELKNGLSENCGMILGKDGAIDLSERYVQIAQEIVSSISQIRGGRVLRFVFGNDDSAITNIVRNKLGNDASWAEKEVSRDQNNNTRSGAAL
ncbi:Pentapeptide repeat-containing protein [Candidatus Cyrtobacter comes]|uniref:Pentapeptide repeat-containing protein n=1 Tax=Candidatus Cyrtobacter comes TaxID=675776 RepID=A0ABU5L9I8_9RICK|nr:pentapeptide repeat-containing protein [Candidatus Cyrtobacter comes]MDZ5762791.1 Pentapeptide repeat-containing protein [Candidatus Cyrtobacter comes]